MIKAFTLLAGLLLTGAALSAQVGPVHPTARIAGQTRLLRQLAAAAIAPANPAAPAERLHSQSIYSAASGSGFILGDTIRFAYSGTRASAFDYDLLAFGLVDYDTLFSDMNSYFSAQLRDNAGRR